MIGLISLLAIAALIAVFAGMYFWARRRGLVAAGPAGGRPSGKRRVSLLTEAAAYVGVILLLVGGATAMGQRWTDISAWGHVLVFTAAALFFLAVGIAAGMVTEPAMQRLNGVSWFLSVIGLACATGFAANEVYHNSSADTLLAIGITTTLYAAVLWLFRQQPLQNLVLFAGQVITICGVIVTLAGGMGRAPSLAFALSLWAFGLVWTMLGWLRYAEPIWMTMPAGVLLALFAPSLGVAEYGWMYAIALATAATAMAVSVPLRNTPLLAAGSVAMFGYLTATVIRYFGEALGIPAALAITGLLIIGLAVATARLLQKTRPPAPTHPAAGKPAGPEAGQPAPPPDQPQQDPGRPSGRDLPKAS